MQTLHWQPYLGQNFRNNSKRLLIVGESHYAQGDSDAAFERDMDLVNTRDFTQRMIEQTQLQRKYTHKPLENLFKAMFGNQIPERSTLWKNIGYYNFIQRTMDYRRQERPSISDFDKGWEAFVEVASVLQPTDCIFIGVEAATSFERMMDKLGVKRTDRLAHTAINGTQPRTASITLQGSPVKLSFIKHSSAYFSPSEWHAFLVEQHGPTIQSLL